MFISLVLFSYILFFFLIVNSLAAMRVMHLSPIMYLFHFAAQGDILTLCCLSGWMDVKEFLHFFSNTSQTPLKFSLDDEYQAT